MGFLDNSGDIILDAVLTDLGRERMARGDGSFKIAKYAAGDDEIDYGKYERNNLNGSPYYDLEILKTPILEAFTDNAGQLKSKLITIPRNNLLYLPILKLVNGELNDGEITSENATLSDDNIMYVTVDLDTSTVKGTGGAASATKDLYTRKGVIRGDGIISTNKNTSMIVIDQGLNTVDLPQSSDLDLDLKETQYILEVDDRLGKIQSPPTSNSNQLLDINFVDDDRIASYYVSLTTNANFVKNIKKPNAAVDATAKTSVIAGPVGTRLLYALRASTELRSSNSLFDKLGSSKSGLTLDGITYSDTFRYIDTTVRVTGVTTGYRLDIPIRFIKKS
jgi:hypothetical protein